MSNNKVEGLKKKAQQKKIIAWDKTEKAISNLIDNREKITIAAVARAAGVSTSYIYKYPELSYRIQTLREQQKYDKPKGVLRDRETILEQEKTELTKEIEMLKHSINTMLSSDNSVEHLQGKNIELTLENQELKKQLQQLEQEVYQLRGVILDRGYQDKYDAKFEIDKRQKVVTEIFDETINTSTELPKESVKET